MQEAAPFPRRFAASLSRLHDLVFGLPRDPSRDLYRFLFHRNAGYLATGLIALAAVLPPDGAGVPVCWFRGLTGLPCPGCGLTRSLSSILHLRFAQAMDYHPFGYVFLLLFAMTAAQLLFTEVMRERVSVFVRSHHAAVRASYLAIVFGFIAFGALRTAAYAWFTLRVP